MDNFWDFWAHSTAQEIDLQTELQWKPSPNSFEVIRAREVNPRDTLNFPKHAFRSIFNPFYGLISWLQAFIVLTSSNKWSLHKILCLNSFQLRCLLSIFIPYVSKIDKKLASKFPLRQPKVPRKYFDINIRNFAHPFMAHFRSKFISDPLFRLHILILNFSCEWSMGGTSIAR